MTPVSSPPSVAQAGNGLRRPTRSDEPAPEIVYPCALGLRWQLLFLLAAVAIPLFYACYTQQVWEDYLITYRFSQNLCDGKGLVYNDGERVHGFTSPLGVLLPAACYEITGRGSYQSALWLFRLLSIVAFAAAGLLLVRSATLPFDSFAPRFFLAVLYFLEIKSIAFSTNGQETAFMLLFLAGALTLFHAPTRWFLRGVCWAGLMWTRPDGCIYIASLVLAEFLFPLIPRRRLLASLAASALVCTVLYLPWFAGAWYYYGSPIPQTVLAKSTYVDPKLAYYVRERLLTLPRWLYVILSSIFSPIYWGYAGWPAWIGQASTVLASACALYWILPLFDRLGRAASLCFALLTLYHTLIPTLFPWYLPPLTVLGFVVLVHAAFALARLAPRFQSLARLFAGAALTLVVLLILDVFVGSCYQMKVRQQVIETSHREQIGRWLKDRVRPGERVYTESLGYVGFFSQATMLDYPGLVSPEVVRLRKEKGLDLIGVIPELHPDWLVLRLADLPLLPASVRNHYQHVKTFDARPQLQRAFPIPGYEYLLYDASYAVLKKVRSFK